MPINRALWIVLTSTILLLASQPCLAGRIERIGLVATDFGWALSAQSLYVTRNNGETWTTSTVSIPGASSEELLDAHFFSNGVGHVLLTYSNIASQHPMLAVGTSRDYGKSWAFDLDITKSMAFVTSEMYDSGRITFIDEKKGWINIGKVSSSNFHAAFILKTNDGHTWTSPNPTGVDVITSVGEMKFLDDRHGYIAYANSLYQTEDGGANWKEAEFPLPKNLLPDGGVRSVQTPDLNSAGHGSVLVVVASLGAQDESTEWSSIVRYETADFGKSWRPAASMKANAVWPIADAYFLKDGAVFEFRAQGETKEVLHHAMPTQRDEPSREVADASTHPVLPVVASSQTIFLNENYGWASTFLPNCTPAVTGCVRLLSTQRNSKGWVDITPKEQRIGSSLPPQGANQTSPVTTSTPIHLSGLQVPQSVQNLPRNRLERLYRDRRQPSQAVPVGAAGAIVGPSSGMPSSPTVNSTIAPSAAIAPGSVSVSKHLAFDSFRVSDLNLTTILPNVWNSSPYFDYNIYLPGTNRVSDPKLTAAFLSGASSIQSLGFGYWTTYIGLQAPSSCGGGYSGQFSATSSTAQSQGVSDAALANTAATSLGIPLGSVIYKDLEAFSGVSNSTCQSAAVSYLQGWAAQMLAYGWKRGFYSSLSTASVLLPLTASSFDDIWISQTQAKGVDTSTSKTIWSLTSPGAGSICDPFGASSPCELWAADQRRRQFALEVNETWGNTLIHVDGDIEDAPTVFGAGQKAYSFGAISYDITGKVLTQINGIGPFIPGSASGVAGRAQQGQATIVGATATAAQNVSGAFVGFIATVNPYSSTFGAPTTVSKPGSFATSLEAINSLGNAVGTSFSSATDTLGTGFLYSSTTQAFTTISCTGATVANPAAINDAGQVVGSAYDSSGRVHGFLWLGGTCTLLDVPSTLGTGTSILGISGQGTMVGSYTGIPSTISPGIANYAGFQGFYDPVAKIFTVTPYPGTSTTALSFLATNSNNAALASTITVLSPSSYSEAQSVFQIDSQSSTPTYPLAVSTNSYTLALNDSYQEVGYYTDSIGAIHGAIWYPYTSAAPPLPARADIQIAPITVTLGSAGILNYSLSITNVSANTGTNVDVVIAVPVGVTLQTATSSSTCQQFGPNVVCTVTSLASNASASFTVALSVPDTSNPPALSISTNCDICDPGFAGSTTQIGSSAGASSADVPLPPWAIAALAMTLMAIVGAQSRGRALLRVRRPQ